MYKAKSNLTVSLPEGETKTFLKGEFYSKEEVKDCDLTNFELTGKSKEKEEAKAKKEDEKSDKKDDKKDSKDSDKLE